MLREDILKNFEKLELLLISDFLLYNLIFAKENLNLDDYKSAIFINLTWLLLKNDNPAYIPKQANLQSSNINLISKEEPVSSKKSIESDLEFFKLHLLPLTIPFENSPESPPVFTHLQIPLIIQYIYDTYIDKFNLFKHVFENKEQNEEIRLMVDISTPQHVAPLKDALYLGYDYQQGEEEEEDEYNGTLYSERSTHLGIGQSINKSRITSARSRISQKQSSRLHGGQPGEITEADELIMIEDETQQNQEIGLIDKIVQDAKVDFDSMIGEVENKFEEKIDGGGKKKKGKK